MASLTYYAYDENGNRVTVRLPNLTGQLLLATTDEPPEGALVADGSEISRTAYPELFEAIGTLYGEGDGETTFNLPDAQNVIYAAGSEYGVGEPVAEGLPEVFGTIGGSLDSSDNGFSGAFCLGEGNAVHLWTGITRTDSGGQIQEQTLYFRASNYNPIYGASSHVTPRGTAFLICIVYV